MSRIENHSHNHVCPKKILGGAIFLAFVLIFGLGHSVSTASVTPGASDEQSADASTRGPAVTQAMSDESHQALSEKSPASASETPGASGEQSADASTQDPAVTQAMRDEFYQALSNKSAASSRTYGKLEPQRQDAVVRHYFASGKSLKNIVMILLEHLSAQIKTS